MLPAEYEAIDLRLVEFAPRLEPENALPIPLCAATTHDAVLSCCSDLVGSIILDFDGGESLNFVDALFVRISSVASPY